MTAKEELEQLRVQLAGCDVVQLYAEKERYRRALEKLATGMYPGSDAWALAVETLKPPKRSRSRKKS